jgi:CheY-like chemotaxis protein
VKGVAAVSPSECNLSVLAVDDDEDILDAYGRYFEGCGIRMTAITDPHEAIARAGEIRPDVIMLDVAMPGLNGFAVIDALRARPVAARIPIVIVTGLPVDLVRGGRVCEDRNVSAYVQKPCTPDQLRALVRAIKTAATAV